MSDTTQLSNDQLRIAIFTETFLPKLDGVVTITCLTLDHLRSIGAEAIVFSPGKHVESYNGYPVVSITPGVPMPMYPEITLSVPMRKSHQRFVEFNPNVVHLANPWCAGLMGLRFAKKMNLPTVMSFHTHLMEMAKFYKLGFLEKPLWALHRYFYKKADYRLATSKRIRDELEAHDFGPTGLWRRGVDPKVFAPGYDAAETRLRLTNGDPDKILLLFVGRVAPEKQIEQIRSVLDAVPNTHLAIVGDGPYREKLEKLMEGTPTTFAGYLKGEALSSAYAAADVFVFPSAIETFGLVVAEAMAAQLPVVSSRVGGVPEIIDSGVNGFIFEPNDIDQMVAYVRQLAENPTLRKEMGEKARLAVENLTWKAIMDDLVADYHRVIAEHRSTSDANNKLV